ncbi:DUF2059 domain-containing protein [Neolewinella aurantiaca]|uniref:DUF2059 domain-containing protein n=1 Tax=Neolewinella aurantiaca TaxID=2602767 RepID=A0A5C7FQM4_9BACT|nr:DUF2059 domain-containing protein [Neolewinella aurantiaca]TXF88334.1 DUF2059 domain-containing protein [Neolewinella aurantiaca]
MKHIILPLLFLSFLSLNAQDTKPQSDSDLDAKITELLKLSGAEAQFSTIIDQMLDMQKMNPLYSDALSKDFWDEFTKEVHQTGYKSLLPDMIQLYKEHFTEEELDHQIAYMSNPLTQKIVAKQPALMQASMSVGAEWGQEIAAKITDKLQQALEERN